MIADITEEEWDAFDHFTGSPHEFVDEWNRIGWAEPAQYEPGASQFGAPVMRVRFVTHGWSGNESISGRLGRTFFHQAWWVSSARGGLTVYEVPLAAWDDPEYAWMAGYIGGTYDPGSFEFLLREPGKLPGGPVRATLEEIAVDYQYVTARWGTREIVQREVSSWRVISPSSAGIPTLGADTIPA